MCKCEDIVRFVKSFRLCWLGHIEHMEENRMPRNMVHCQIIGAKRKED
jgi:hypothetical protein